MNSEGDGNLNQPPLPPSPCNQGEGRGEGLFRGSGVLNPDEVFMMRAIQLAAKGRGRVEPNPMVGCVLVKNDRIIGEGRHEFFGGPHAEPNALKACNESPAGATAYVNLEPCCHANKKTPPCVPALIAAKVARVVVGCLDPNPSVSGQGIRQLAEAGIPTTAGVLENESKQLNAAYFAGVLHGRPYVTLKWAETADGYVAGPGGTRLQISNAASQRVVYELRSRCDAILIGSRTADMDDPLLTVREIKSERKPLRVILDSHLQLSASSQLARTASEYPTLIYHNDRASPCVDLPHIEKVALGQLGGVSLEQVLADLYRRRVTHLLVEPGPRLARGFLQANLADRIWRFRSPMALYDSTAPKAAQFDYLRTAEVDLSGDSLEEFLNPFGAVFFTSAASADISWVHGRGE